jgi:transcriptional regulator with GAF, ATPase, and Fis domain
MRNNAAQAFQTETHDIHGVSLKVLRELSYAISGALEAVDSFHPPDVRRGINFYEEVRRFEIDLIRTALKLSGGSQTRAARLLRLNPTTLNSKIKYYSIDWRNGYLTISQASD